MGCQSIEPEGKKEERDVKKSKKEVLWLCEHTHIALADDAVTVVVMHRNTVVLIADVQFPGMVRSHL